MNGDSLQNEAVGSLSFFKLDVVNVCTCFRSL